VERLVVELTPRQIIASLVARAVYAAPLEEQRPELVARDDVEQPGRRCASDFADRAIRSLRLGLVATPLIGDRRIEAEGPDTPPSVETRRPPVLVIRCVTGGSATANRAHGVHRTTDCPNVGGVAPRAGRGGQTVSVKVRDHRLQIQTLERCELRALNDCPVLA